MSAAPHPFRIHFVDRDGATGSELVHAATAELARRAFTAKAKNAGAHIRKVKLDRSREQA